MTHFSLSTRFSRVELIQLGTVKKLLASLALFLFLFISPTAVFADSPDWCDPDKGLTVSSNFAKDELILWGSSPNKYITISNLTAGNYTIQEVHQITGPSQDTAGKTKSFTVGASGTATISIDNDWFAPSTLEGNDTWDMFIKIVSLDCTLAEYDIQSGEALDNLQCTVDIFALTSDGKRGTGCFSKDNNPTVEVSMKTGEGKPYEGGPFWLKIQKGSGIPDSFGREFNTDASGLSTWPLIVNNYINGTNDGYAKYITEDLQITIWGERRKGSGISTGRNICESDTIRFKNNCTDDDILGPPEDKGKEVTLCDQVPGPMKEQCTTCKNDFDGQGLWTAVGCIRTDKTSIVKSIVLTGLSISGGIVLLMMVAGGFILSTSRGDPKQVTQAKDMITSAITGLLIILFSVVILRFIGVSVFNIPGFGTT